MQVENLAIAAHRWQADAEAANEAASAAAYKAACDTLIDAVRAGQDRPMPKAPWSTITVRASEYLSADAGTEARAAILTAAQHALRGEDEAAAAALRRYVTLIAEEYAEQHEEAFL